jgi:flagellar basal body-associated protein FliL
MNGFEENEGINKKQIIIVFIVAILLIALIVSVVLISNASKKKKLQEEKAKRAESLKVEDFLTEIAKENWQEVKVKEDCQISHINPSFNGFSWIGKEK